MKQKTFLFYVFFIIPLLGNAITKKFKTVEEDGLIYELIVFEGGHPATPIGAYVSGIKNLPSNGVVSIKKEFSVQMYNDEIGEEFTGIFKVIGLDNAVFRNCVGLKEIYIPATVVSTCSVDDYIDGVIYDWGENPFVGCVNLSKITVDEDHELIDSRDNCNAIIKKEGNRLLSGCKNTVIPESVFSIGVSAFEGSDISSIVLNNIIDIDGKAFWNCINLKDVYITGKEYFPMTYNSFDESANNAILHVNDNVIERVKEDKSFSVFKEIVVNEIVTDFNLTYYVDGEEYKKEQYKYNDEITPLEEPTKEGYTFSGWSEIPTNMPGKDVKVEGTFTRNDVIEDGIIYWALDNQAAVIGNDNAAGEVKIVASVTFNEKSVPVIDIVDFSFKNNTDITSVVISESVMKIGDEAFYGCKNLTKIELGKSVNQIEPRAFAGIDKLTDVICYAEDLPDADRTAFENSYTEDYVTLHVPAGSIEKYKAAAPWKNFKDIVAIEGTEDANDEDPAQDSDGDDATEDVITLKDSGKGTWCSENDLDFTDLEDIKAYIASGYDDIKKTIWLTRVYSVPAGTGIMVKGTPGEHKIPYAKVRAYYANMFKGVVGDAVKIEATDGDWTNYYMAGGQFKIVNGSTTINPNRCYLQLPTLVFAGTRSVDVVYEDEIDDKTGINPSFVTNDQEPAEIYNLQGQRVKNPKKGVYLRNGKKVIVR